MVGLAVTRPQPGIIEACYPVVLDERIGGMLLTDVSPSPARCEWFLVPSALSLREWGPSTGACTQNHRFTSNRL